MSFKSIKKIFSKRAAYKAFDQMSETQLLDLGLDFQDVKKRTVKFA
ncbi:MAG: hypothetical protein HRU28_09620 [Rhizobiales bacterium]|nr:hypothetical protein [Hyphomicrobiales bacterium]